MLPGNIPLGQSYQWGGCFKNVETIKKLIGNGTDFRKLQQKLLMDWLDVENWKVKGKLRNEKLWDQVLYILKVIMKETIFGKQTGRPKYKQSMQLQKSSMGNIWSNSGDGASSKFFKFLLVLTTAYVFYDRQLMAAISTFMNHWLSTYKRRTQS